MQRVTIFEFAPTADEIWRISKHNRDGYASYNAENGLVSILDTTHDAKQRPEIITTYAGGKATNVARVLDRLLVDESDVYVELTTFLPPPPAGPLQDLDFGNMPLRPSTPAGIYVQCLQMLGLRRVRPRFQVVDELEETGKMQTTRRCIEITLGDSGASLNFSPRIMWSQRAAEAVLSRASQVARDADLVVMAGAPPVWDVSEGAHLTTRNFYARIIDALKPDCQVSIDTRGQYLYDCLVGQRKPRFILMNTDEFSELLGLLTDMNERVFPGTLIIHDEHGSWVWNNELPSVHDPFPEAAHFPSVPVHRIYSTIGAGDAMHAGLLKEWICAGSGARGNTSQDERLHRAVVYSQVVAAASVSNSKATHGIDAHTVEARFRRIWQGS